MQWLNWLHKTSLLPGALTSHLLEESHCLRWDWRLELALCSLSIFVVVFFQVPAECDKPFDKALDMKYLDPTSAHFSFHPKSNLNCALEHVPPRKMSCLPGQPLIGAIIYTSSFITGSREKIPSISKYGWKEKQHNKDDLSSAKSTSSRVCFSNLLTPGVTYAAAP